MATTEITTILTSLSRHAALP
eukprot:SAG25_NODE_1522_length_2848_cov_2.074209_1_plen_20_part_10